MNNLAKVFIVKIALTLIFWSVPLIVFPASLMQTLGFPEQTTYVFIRLLGWAYLSLCVGYYFGLKAAFRGEQSEGPIWAGIVSNGGACIYLLYFGLNGVWSEWGVLIQLLLWVSAFATGGITLGLYLFGVRAKDTVSS